MKVLDIRARMLLAALLPVLLISLLLAAFFMLVRVDDLELSHAQRNRALARQLALASEYDLFSANHAQLQSLMMGALQESDVRWVGVYDNQGHKLVSAGYESGNSPLVFNAQESHGFDASRGLDWLAQPVLASGIKLDDLYQGVAAEHSAKPQHLGQVQLVISRQSLHDRRRDMLLLGALIAALGLGFGLLLALFLSRGVLRPIARVTRLVECLGRGDFAQAQAEAMLTGARDPLQDLQHNLHRTASQLAVARDELEQQVLLATRSLREKKDEAEQANRAKSRFLSAASHDLRQPIHALGLFVTRLAQLSHDAQTQQLVSQLQASVRAVQVLLDGLLDISRLQSLTVPLPQPVSVAELLAQLQGDLAPAALEKGLKLRIRPTTLWVKTDAALIYRVLLNLTSNALRYTHSGSVLVTARLSGASQQVLLQVWDSGVGIAPEHQEHIFEEFFQVAAGTHGNHGRGLGLGLNIVQRSVKLLGHGLQVRSALGCGTRMTLCLPREEAQVALVNRTGALWQPLLDSPLADDLLGQAVLVIEDDALARAALLALLEGWGMQVFAADSLAQASGLIAAGCRPALIISDYCLHGAQDGIGAIAALRAQLGQAVAACLVSGNTEAGLLQLAQNAQLTLLHKPVRPAKLRSLLRRLLMQQRTPQAPARASLP